MNKQRFAIFLSLVLALAGCTPKESVQLSENATYVEIVDAAVKMNDVGICSRFSNIKPVTLAAENITLAENVDLGCMYESGCISSVAYSARDTGLCNRIRKCNYPEDARASCVSDIEVEKVQDVALKGDYKNCLYLNGDVSMLQGDIERKELCLHYVAVNQTNPDICEMIEKSDNLRDTCFFSVTDLKNPEDAAICLKIKSEDMKSACLQLYEQDSAGKIVE